MARMSTRTAVKTRPFPLSQQSNANRTELKGNIVDAKARHPQENEIEREEVETRILLVDGEKIKSERQTSLDSS